MPGTDNVGFRTGRGSGIGVLDLDTDKGRISVDVALEEVRAVLGELPATYTVRTPTGGLHLHFRLPEGDFTFRSTVRQIGPHVDTRGDSGLVVYKGRGVANPEIAPGRLTPIGERRLATYDVIDPTPPVPLPESLYRWMLEYEVRRTAPAIPGTSQGRPKASAPPARESEDWRYAVDVVATSLPTSKHDVRLALGGALLWHGWTSDDVFAFVSDVYSALGDETPEARLREPIDNAERKIASGMLVTGWGVLYDVLGFDGAERLRRVLRMKDEPIELFKAPEPASPELNPRARRPGHHYTFEYGARAAQKANASGPSELAHYLLRHPSWNDPTPVLWFDARAQKVRAFNPPFEMDAERDGGLSDEDVEVFRSWCECAANITVTTDAAFRALVTASKRRQYDPVIDYLDALPKAPEGAIRRLAEAMGLSLPIELAFLEIFLVGAVARAYRPGIPMRHMLILYGPQEAGKSTWVRLMFGDWSREGLPPVDQGGGTAAALALKGYWGVEIPELATWLRGDEASKKEFVTRLKDTYRAPYARTEVTVARGSVFVGTTNEDVFLYDATGETRYLPLKVGAMDVAALALLRNDVWAEARDIYRAWDGRSEPPWYLPAVLRSEAENYREQFQGGDPWEGAVLIYAKGKIELPSAAEVWKGAIANHDPGALQKAGTRDTRRMSALLQKLGFTKTQSAATRRIVYTVPEKYR